MKTRQDWIDFFRVLEQYIPPPAGCHHALHFAQYGSDDTEWTDRVAVQVNDNDTMHVYFLDDQDFEMTGGAVAKGIFDIHHTTPAEAPLKMR